jgi:hypothetical protein
MRRLQLLLAYFRVGLAKLADLGPKGRVQPRQSEFFELQAVHLTLAELEEFQLRLQS